MENHFSPPVILIPTYKPDHHLVKTVKSLQALASYPIILVDDGNTRPEDKKLFQDIEKFNQVTVLHHQVNQGKGVALKTGIHYIKNKFPYTYGCVTADADGQHSPHDIIKTCSSLIDYPDHLILGSRQFDSHHVPFKSAIGNRFTSLLFKLITGRTCSDTQTGLRGIPQIEFDNALHTRGSRFDYEMNYLLSAAKRKIPFKPITIETIYRDENKHSHYHPLKDSLKILSILFKFSFSSWIGALVDLSLFALFLGLGWGQTSLGLMTSSIIARMASAIINYILNIKYVFQTAPHRTNVTKYALLFIGLMLISSYATATLPPIFESPITTKILIDLFLFFISYTIQRDLIFRPGEVQI